MSETDPGSLATSKMQLPITIIHGTPYKFLVSARRPGVSLSITHIIVVL